MDYWERRFGSSLTPTRPSWVLTACLSISIRRETPRRTWWSGTYPATGSTRASRNDDLSVGGLHLDDDAVVVREAHDVGLVHRRRHTRAQFPQPRQQGAAIE